MHEMSLCESIIQIVEEQAVVQGFSKVKTVCLEIGQLSGIEPEAMLFSFDVVTRGTCAENAKLKIIKIDALAWCLQCAKTVKIQQRFDGCPDCGSYQLQVSGGDELKIRELEVN